MDRRPHAETKAPATAAPRPSGENLTLGTRRRRRLGDHGGLRPFGTTFELDNTGRKGALAKRGSVALYDLHLEGTCRLSSG